MVDVFNFVVDFVIVCVIDGYLGGEEDDCYCVE